MNKYNKSSLKSFLEQACGCKYHGKPIPRPYASADDLLDEYSTAEGHYFSVPDPDHNDGTYSDIIVNKILEINSLAPQLYEAKKLVDA